MAFPMKIAQRALWMIAFAVLFILTSCNPLPVPEPTEIIQALPTVETVVEIEITEEPVLPEKEESTPEAEEDASDEVIVVMLDG
jgi:hypothetical protein